MIRRPIPPAYPTPLQWYRQALQQVDFVPDPAQERVVEHTTHLHQQLLQERAASRHWRRLWFRHLAKKTPVQGLYLWGGVGCGKTWLMDGFHSCLLPGQGLRLHFHRFMNQVHALLRRLPTRRDPLPAVIARLCQGVQVLCLDEFHVEDITDAMLLSGVLDALFVRGVALVSTSNEKPDALYSGGLQRERFAPAIALIQTHTCVLCLDSDTDYRQRYLDRAARYHIAPIKAQHTVLQGHFNRITGLSETIAGALRVNGRAIPFLCASEGVVWFAFTELCDGPRAVPDYIELARCYHTVLLSGVPVMRDVDNESAKRFINLIDEFYDRRVKLIIGAEAPPESLYIGRRLRQAFQRTGSRLQEMGSRAYLSCPHRS